MAQYYNSQESDLIEKVVFVNRTSKATKGGRNMALSALVVVGDGEGTVGLGFGKALEVSDAIAKALTDGRKNLVTIPRYNTTIPFKVTGKFKGGKVLLKPATSGTGIIAGGAVRAVVEAAGIKDILSKSLGSDNKGNVAKATLDGLLQLIDKRSAFKKRGIHLKEFDVETRPEEPVVVETEQEEPEKPVVAETEQEVTEEAVQENADK